MNIQFYRQLIFDVDNAPTWNEKQTALHALLQYLRSLLEDKTIVEEKIQSGEVTMDDLRTISSIEELRRELRKLR